MVEGARSAEQAADEEGAAHVGDEPDVDEGRDEGRALGGDTEVAGTGEGKAGARGRAVHRREDRLLELADGEHGRVVVTAQAAGDVARGLAELVQVLPDAETAARARDDNRADARVPRFLERPDQLLVPSMPHAERERLDVT